jgi:hypothetical protein
LDSPHYSSALTTLLEQKFFRNAGHGLIATILWSVDVKSAAFIPQTIEQAECFLLLQFELVFELK